MKPQFNFSRRNPRFYKATKKERAARAAKKRQDKITKTVVQGICFGIVLFCVLWVLR